MAQSITQGCGHCLLVFGWDIHHLGQGPQKRSSVHELWVLHEETNALPIAAKAALHLLKGLKPGALGRELPFLLGQSIPNRGDLLLSLFSFFPEGPPFSDFFFPLPG